MEFFLDNERGPASLAHGTHEGEIPEVVIRRLPIYARTLDELLQRGIRTISSNELADRIGVTAAQIRRDLSYFGRFGKQGRGYDIAFLIAEIRRILKEQQGKGYPLGDVLKAVLKSKSFLGR